MEFENCSKEELICELIQLRKCNNELEKHLKQTEVALKEAEEKYRFKLEQEVNHLTTEFEYNQPKEKLEQSTTDKYLKLFNSIDQGFFVIDVIFDENDNPVDMYFVEANEASITILGSDYSNRYLKDIDPNYESYWFEIFGEVALTGKNVRMEQYAEPDKKWYSFYVFKIGDESSRIIGNIFLDITERKRREDSLKETEEKFRPILENSIDGISLLDLKTGKYLYFSPSKVKMTGFSLEEIKYASVELVFERMHPDDREIAMEKHRLVSTGIETLVDVEYRWKVKSGEFRWFSDRRKLVRDKNGQPVAIVGISREITDQKEYENKIELQAKILSNVKDAIIVVDENGMITYCNKAYVKLLGWQSQESIGRSIFYFVQYFVDDASKEKVLLYLEENRKPNSEVDEDHLAGIICYSKDGTQIIIDVNRAVVRDSKDEFKGFILSIRDVSERYKYELELKKSEERYRYLFNSIDEGLAIIEVIFDKENKPKDFRFIELNPACEKQMDLIIKNAVGKNAKKLKSNIEDFWSETLSIVALTGEPIRFVKEIKILNIWIDAYVFKIDLGKGTKLGVLFNDITEEVMHNRKVEELIKMQDDLYVNVSHELKTPLNVIFSANQVMNMYLKSDSIEDKKDKLFNYNNSIKQNCYRLIKLVNNIVDLSKSKSGLLMLNLCNVNIVEVIESIVQSISEYVKSKELKIIFDTNIEEKIIACDSDKIERIMLNLISNAIKFSNPNGEIFVNVLSKEETVEITVKDTGIGIEKQNLDNIFNRFYQEDKSLSRNAEGSGIGLSLIKSFVELHGGNISVVSEINKGSIFKVVLPAKTIESQEFRELAKSMNDKIETIKIEFSDIYSINNSY
jgi:PAS domain S-box-containing protein